MGSEAENTWKELVWLVATKGDVQAFARLFDHFAPRIEAYLIRLGQDQGRAEEIAQEVMTTLWQKAGQYDPLQASVSTWLYRIARNRNIDAGRRRRDASIDPHSSVFLEIIDRENGADEKLSAGEEASIVVRVIETLPEEQRRLIVLAFYEGMSHSEIASLTGQPLGTVKSRIRLAFARMRHLLEKRGLEAS